MITNFHLLPAYLFKLFYCMYFSSELIFSHLSQIVFSFDSRYERSMVWFFSKVEVLETPGLYREEEWQRMDAGGRYPTGNLYFVLCGMTMCPIAWYRKGPWKDQFLGLIYLPIFFNNSKTTYSQAGLNVDTELISRGKEVFASWDLVTSDGTFFWDASVICSLKQES